MNENQRMQHVSAAALVSSHIFIAVLRATHWCRMAGRIRTGSIAKRSIIFSSMDRNSQINDAGRGLAAKVD